MVFKSIKLKIKNQNTKTENQTSRCICSPRQESSFRGLNHQLNRLIESNGRSAVSMVGTHWLLDDDDDDEDFGLYSSTVRETDES